MSNKRWILNTFLLILLTISGIFFVGCTQLVWQMDDGIYEDYNDTINSFIMTDDSSKIIFISSQYHYVFNNNDKELLYLLQHRDKISVKFDLKGGSYYVHTDKNNTIDARFFASINTRKTDKNFIDIIMKDPRSNYHEKENNIHIFFTLPGVRYLSDLKVNDKLVPLDPPITLKMTQTHKDKSATFNKILITPLLIVGDIVVLGAFGVSQIIVVPQILYREITK
jgi:nitrogen fixation-related uncharacterized protein